MEKFLSEDLAPLILFVFFAGFLIFWIIVLATSEKIESDKKRNYMADLSADKVKVIVDYENYKKTSLLEAFQRGKQNKKS